MQAVASACLSNIAAERLYKDLVVQVLYCRPCLRPIHCSLTCSHMHSTATRGSLPPSSLWSKCSRVKTRMPLRRQPAPSGVYVWKTRSLLLLRHHRIILLLFLVYRQNGSSNRKTTCASLTSNRTHANAPVAFAARCEDDAGYVYYHSGTHQAVVWLVLHRVYHCLPTLLVVDVGVFQRTSTSFNYEPRARSAKFAHRMQGSRLESVCKSLTAMSRVRAFRVGLSLA